MFIMLILVISVSVILLVSRIFYLIFRVATSECNFVSKSSLRTVVCIGSGGHTTEMLRLCDKMAPTKFGPRLYLMAETDTSSEFKVKESLKELERDLFAIKRIPRSRHVGQSYWTSILTTLYATLLTIPIIFKFKPNVVICNGPGTCIPICVISFLLRALFIIDCRIIFVESICRVRTLSLSGKILQFIADVFVVQWPTLQSACWRSKYFGRLT